MTDKIKQVQSQIDGSTIAQMQMDFYREFRDTYNPQVLMYIASGVGPMHSFIGHAIARGYLKPTDVEPPQLWRKLTLWERITGRAKY